MVQKLGPTYLITGAELASKLKAIERSETKRQASAHPKIQGWERQIQAQRLPQDQRVDPKSYIITVAKLILIEEEYQAIVHID